MKFEDIYPEVARPYVAAFVILRRGSKVAMVLRKNTGWMDGHYGLPAGKGEWFEPFTDAAIREANEEVGVKIQNRSQPYKSCSCCTPPRRRYCLTEVHGLDRCIFRGRRMGRGTA